MADDIFDGLNEAQAEAVAAVRGPVCIIAGAGSGKTTTITRRIANQVATEAFFATDILAVTFTDKAAREMASRLAALGVRGVRARTFHAEALAQYRHFSDDPNEIVPSKAQLIAPLVARLRPPYRFTALRDVATEIEWAKNRRVDPAGYVAASEGRHTAVPPEIMAGVYAGYERAKARARLMDFEDLISRTIDLLHGDHRSREAVRGRYLSFTVDEYQDVNPLQHELLGTWLGDREDVCVVGDDYQSIFGFTGATPAYLLGFPERHLDCLVVRLTENYRSTPQVLAAANRLALGGSNKTLRPTLADGPEPLGRDFDDGAAETAWIVARIGDLRSRGVPAEEIAVLYRINGRSEALEEALSAASIPYQVRDGAFLRRPAARALLSRLRREPDGDVAATVERLARRLGWDPGGEADAEELGPEEATRRADLGRLVHLAREFGGDPGRFAADLRRRFAAEEDGRGVQLLTYHRSKGLEFEAVFLPRLEEKEMPFALSRTDEEIAEERRLFYVGITRAKRWLFLSWARSRADTRRRAERPSPFLAEIAPGARVPAARAAHGAGRREPVAVEAAHTDLFTALKQWRLGIAQREGVPAYVVFNDRALAAIAERRPTDRRSLLGVPGVGPAKLDRYGDAVLALVAEHPAARAAS